MKSLIFIISLSLLLFSCKKESNTKLPEYYITFNDGNLNKTYIVESNTSDDIWLSPSTNYGGFYSTVNCYPKPGLDVGILADFNFAIRISIPIDSLDMVTKFKTGKYEIKASDATSVEDCFFKDFPEKYGLLTGAVKYSNKSPFYRCDDSNNSSNSYNKINSIKYLDKVYDHFLNVYQMRFVIEGEYKMTVKQYPTNDSKTITGKYRTIVERFYTEFKN